MFDREAELAELLEALKGSWKFIILVGIRRVGKTSLLKVALNEWGKPSIIQLLRRIDEWTGEEGLTLPIVFDEAQELRYFKGRFDIAKLIAYSYDNLENVKFVLKCSEAGLLYSTLDLFDSK